MSWKTTLTLLVAATGSFSIGLVSIAQARVAAFSDGTFSFVSWAACAVALSISGGVALGRTLTKWIRRDRPADVPPLQHPSMLASVATAATRGEPVRRERLALAIVLPLSAILPVASIVQVVRSADGVDGADLGTMLATTTFAAWCLAAGVGAQPDDTERRTQLSLWAALAVGWLAGVGLGGRAVSPIVGLNEYASASLVFASAAAISCVLTARLQRWYSPIIVGIAILATGRGATYAYSELDDAYERLTPLEGRNQGERFARVFENRHGALTVTTAGWLHQNGRVQGIFNTSPIPAADINRCSRAYVIPATLSRPLTILMLGLGSGSFAQILVHHPSVKRLVVLEENPAYLEAVRNSGQVASLANNDKFVLIDGAPHQTLKAQGKFDLIIMDRLPYRREASHLLTEKHFQMLSRHLEEGGAVYVNTLQRTDVERTLLESFSHLLRYQDMIFASQSRLRVDGYQWMRDLMAWSIDGYPVLPTERDPTEVARHIVKNRDFRGEFAWERENAIRARISPMTSPGSSGFQPKWWQLEKLP